MGLAFALRLLIIAAVVEKSGVGSLLAETKQLTDNFWCGSTD